MRRRPYGVVLFDEIEKAHPEVFNVLLQLLDDGRLTDGQGRQVDFKNAIVIMTSNLGSDLILASGSKSLAELRPKIDELLRAAFRPEFLNRIDETIMFDRLGKAQIRRIVDIQLARLVKRLGERKLALEVTDGAKDWLATVGYDPQFGARPLKRAVQSEVENPLAKRLLAGEFREGDTIAVDAGKEGLEFTKK